MVRKTNDAENLYAPNGLTACAVQAKYTHMVIDKRYEVIRSLDGGVYKVRDRSTGAILALKLLESEEPDLVMDFKNEFSTLANLDHPHILRVYDLRKIPNGYYFTMEFIDGENIFDHFTQRKSNLQALYSVVGEVLQALHHVHQRGLIHGDVKPQNIMVQKAKAKLLDFGLARVVGTSSNRAGGTLAYIAPELFKGGKIDPRVDLYSLGVVLYEILRRKRLESMNEEIHPLPASVPRSLAHVISKLTKPDPDQRYSCVKEVWEDLFEHMPEVKLTFTPSILTSPTIGRDVEISELQRLFADSTQKGRVVLIVGERGIGKSRVLRESGYRRQLEECCVIYVACPRDERTPLVLVRSIFQEIGLEVDNLLEMSKDFPHDKAQFKLFEGLTNLFLEFSRAQRSVVLIIDELDCADPLSIEFLTYLSPEISEIPVFIMGALEDETKVHSLIEKAQHTDSLKRIDLERLSPEDTRAMICSMLSSEGLDDIADWIYEKTGGNPLHIEKTLEYLMKMGYVYRRRDHWELDRVKAEALKPEPSLASLIDLSLRSHEPDELKALKYASVIGNFFDTILLQRLLGYDDRRFYPLLLKLRYSDAIREVKGTEYAFSHGWMREVLHERIPASRRKNLHRRAFQILKQIGSSPERLFYHALHSGYEKEAYDYALVAGGEAERNLAPYIALDYYERALELSKKLKKRDDAFLYRRLADLQHLTGSYDEALNNYRHALTLRPSADDVYVKIGKVYRDKGDHRAAIHWFTKLPESLSGDYLDALNQMAWTYVEINDLKHASQAALKVKKLSERVGNTKSLADSFHNLAQIALRRDDYEEAVQHLHSSLEMKQRINDEYGMAVTENNLAIAHWKRGEIPEAESYYLHSLKLMEKIGDVKTVALLNNNLGIVYRQKEEWEKALAHYEKSYQFYRKIGDTKSLVAVYNNLAVAHHHRGEWTKAAELYRKSLDLSQQMDMETEQATTLHNLGRILLDMGDLEEAFELLQRSLELAKRLNDEEGTARVSIEIGRYWLEGGFWERSLETLTQSLSQFDSRGDADAARIFTLQAQIYLKTDKLRNAGSQLSKAERYYRKLNDVNGLGRVERLKAVLCSLRDELRRAHEHFNKSREIFEQTQQEYELALTLLEMAHHYLRQWRARNDPEDMQRALTHVRDAEDIFTRFHAAARLEETHTMAVELLDLVSTGLLPACSRLNQLNTLYEVSKLINSILNLELLFDTTMRLVLQLLRAERGVLLLLNPETAQLEVVAGKEMDKETIRDVTKLSSSIIARVTKRGEPIICSDALSDSRFKKRKSVILHNIRSLLCVPLKTDQEVLGTIYVDSRLSNNVFTEHDRDFLVALANLVAVAIDRARLHQKLEKETVSLKREVVKRYSFQGLVGKNQKMQEVYSLIEKVSRTDSTVLITGATGTGKDLVAQAIHSLSNRRDNSILTVSCVAIPENLLESELFGHARGAFTGATTRKRGLFEVAHGGTLFLDEIGDAPPSIQAKLLRVLETGEIRRLGETDSRKVDVRVICATNKDLRREMEEGRFREDLFYRLNVVHIHLPPLTERREDIPIIADHFRRLYSKTYNKEIKKFSKELIDFLCKHDWRGNVRELESRIATAVSMSDSDHITVDDLTVDEPPETAKGFRESREFFEMSRIKQALNACNGNRTQAAQLLGIKRQQLQRYIKKYRISIPSQNKKDGATN